MNENSRPMVSVWMITYNHEEFITEAIDGVLMQQTNFQIELIIGEDCSTDKTAEIIKAYQEKHPEIIKARFNKPNIGMMPNVIKTLEECTGKYIALCEGDDYWTDPLKLQKQVDFLENNGGYSGCFHDTEVKYIDSLKNNILFSDFPANPFHNLEKHIFTIEDTFLGIIGHTSSFMFRNKALDRYVKNNKLFSRIPFGDNVMISAVSEFGNLYRLNDIMSVYQINDQGVTKASSDFNDNKKWLDNKISLYQIQDAYFDYKYSKIIYKRIKYYKNKLTQYFWWEFLKQKSFSNFAIFFKSNNVFFIIKLIYKEVLNKIKIVLKINNSKVFIGKSTIV